MQMPEIPAQPEPIAPPVAEIPEAPRSQPQPAKLSLRVLQMVLIAGTGLGLIYLFAPHSSAPSAALRPPQKRLALPDYRFPLVGGGDWSLGAQRGSVVLVNFWATWCPPCRMETPELVRLSQKYGRDGLRVVGISMDDNPKQVVPDFVSRFHVPYPMVTPAPQFGIASAIQSLPTTLLIDRQGRIAQVFEGALTADDVRPDIVQLLQERP